jgi:benzoyl-CoA reductase/2-hydroxyglutaryl-CoA dehydratase subunit BcrC/BadD/HgdB
VAAEPAAAAAALKERSRLPVVGYFDNYLPEELILAHGVLPFRVAVDDRDEVRAGESIQLYACPSSRNLLDQALRGDLDFLDGALFTRYCDSLRGVYAVWDSRHLTPYVDFVRYPTVTTTDTAVDYLAAELREVSQRMGDALGTEADERRLWEAAAACRLKRALVARLARARADRSLPLMGSDYLAVLVAATTMLPDEFTSALASLLEHPPAGEPGDAVPVVLSSTTFDNVRLASLIEQSGFYLAGDDLASGSRWWSIEGPEAPAGEDGGSDPWRALARAYLRRPPCSVKEPAAPRTDHLLEQVKATGARGVIFYLTRFCDSEQVEWPYVRDRLAAEGVPALLLEGDHRSAGFAQLQTRLEAFGEQLEEVD